ncbi:hypothetical protein K492DRAFT_144848 [Lichtheimia hyalospora FSU 10163]|nr:hypothetical protein K492DRAFT_144848 [Lichtheimia hyalospora FSU 10163]
MDVQEFIHPRAQDTHQQTSSSAHYHSTTFIESNSFPNANAATSPKLTAMSRPALPTILENGDSNISVSMASMNNVSQAFTTSTPQTSEQQQHQLLTPGLAQENSSDGNDDMEDPMNPIMLMNRFDKRKSSPAVLGLPYGMGGPATGISSSMSSSNAQAQQLGLQQHRNSIEAAMLLANFNRISPVERTSPPDDKGSTTWQDDTSVAQAKNSWISNDGSQLTIDTDTAMRRHSYDVGMDWNDLPETRSLFNNGRIDFLSEIGSVDGVNTPGQVVDETTSKLTWTNDGSMLNNDTSTGEYAQLLEFIQHPASTSPASVLQYAKVSPHTSSPRPSLYNNTSIKYPLPPPYPGMPPQHQPPLPPSFQQTSIGQKREYPGDGYVQQQGYRSTMPVHPYYYQQQPGMTTHPNTAIHPMSPGTTTTTTTTAPVAPTATASTSTSNKTSRRKRTRFDDEEGEVVEPGDKDFPAMSPRDVEAARTDPEARPRRQKLRFDGDQYTPQWVRYNGQSKEGLCDTCSPGKWLQLKNSAFWYHKQFFHGISSVSGQPFVKPLETRWVDQDLVEGLCHQCRQWVPVSNVKRKNSVLWYRHAHKCHVYNKPKASASKKR